MNTELLKELRGRSGSCIKKCGRAAVLGEGRAWSGAAAVGGTGGGGAGVDGGSRAGSLLPHISCLLALFGGAALATCARLKWDPSAYVALRELWPAEYRAVCAALPVYCAVVVALNHLAVSAPLARRPARRRLLLCVYAALTLVLLVCEGVLAGWLAARLARWLHSPEARLVLDAMDFKDYFVGPVLSFFGRFIPVSRKAKALMDEADADAPYNLYCACAAGAAFVLLQLLAAALALLARPPPPARRLRPPRPCCCRREVQNLKNGGSHRGSSTYIDMAPLGGAPRSGRPPPPAPAPVL